MNDTNGFLIADVNTIHLSTSMPSNVDRILPTGTKSIVQLIVAKKIQQASSWPEDGDVVEFG